MVLRAGASLACAWLAGSLGTAIASDWDSSNVQLLYGHGFDDRYTGANAGGGGLATFTFETLSVRDWGDSFLFVDVNGGRLVDFDGARRDRSSQVYAEWQPRLRLGRGDPGEGALRAVYLAGQVDAGDDGFRAGLIGFGADFALPGFTAFGANLYWRDDTVNRPTAQLTVFWSAVLGDADSGWSSEGFLDLAGTDRDGTDVVFQPRLLNDVGRGLGGRPGRWYAGLEWYYHRNDALAVSVPQLMLKRVLP
jgi:nucleoside-specific outer membrane channel protein Tsx